MRFENQTQTHQTMSLAIYLPIGKRVIVLTAWNALPLKHSPKHTNERTQINKPNAICIGMFDQMNVKFCAYEQKC